MNHYFLLVALKLVFLEPQLPVLITSDLSVKEIIKRLMIDD